MEGAEKGADTLAAHLQHDREAAAASDKPPPRALDLGRRLVCGAGVRKQLRRRESRHGQRRRAASQSRHHGTVHVIKGVGGVAEVTRPIQTRRRRAERSAARAKVQLRLGRVEILRANGCHCGPQLQCRETRSASRSTRTRQREPHSIDEHTFSSLLQYAVLSSASAKVDVTSSFQYPVPSCAGRRATASHTHSDPYEPQARHTAARQRLHIAHLAADDAVQFGLHLRRYLYAHGAVDACHDRWPPVPTGAA